jgi:hypothetical protein
VTTAGHGAYSPDRMLEIVRRVRFYQRSLHRKHAALGLSTRTPEQNVLFDVVNPPASAVKALWGQF